MQLWQHRCQTQPVCIGVAHRFSYAGDSTTVDPVQPQCKRHSFSQRNSSPQQVANIGNGSFCSLVRCLRAKYCCHSCGVWGQPTEVKKINSDLCISDKWIAGVLSRGGTAAWLRRSVTPLACNAQRALQLAQGCCNQKVIGFSIKIKQNICCSHLNVQIQLSNVCHYSPIVIYLLKEGLLRSIVLFSLPYLILLLR